VRSPGDDRFALFHADSSFYVRLTFADWKCVIAEFILTIIVCCGGWQRLALAYSSACRTHGAGMVKSMLSSLYGRKQKKLVTVRSHDYFH
jgi:hypothetical protein